MMLRFAFTMKLANVIETDEHAGSSKKRDVSPQGNKRNHELVNVCRGVSAQ